MTIQATANDFVPTARDYSLIGKDSKRAVENGLAAAQWYHTDIPRKRMKELMQRSDGPAIRDTAIWLGLLVAFGAAAAAAVGQLVVGAVLPLLRRALRLRRPTRAGTNAGTAPPSRRAG